MRRRRAPATVAAAGLLAAGLAWAQSPSRVGPFDDARVAGEVPAMEGGALLGRLSGINDLEVALGELAESKGLSEEVRRYGTLLKDDHRLLDHKLITLAERLGIGVKKRADPELLAALKKLGEANPVDFDRLFLRAVHDGRQKAIAAIESGRRTEVAAVRELAAKVLPILRQHEKLASGLKPETAGGNHG